MRFKVGLDKNFDGLLASVNFDGYLYGPVVGQPHNGGIGGEQLAVGNSLANSLPWDRPREKQSADERVCIDDHARPSFRPTGGLPRPTS